MRILMGSFYSGGHEGGAEKQGRLLASEFARRGIGVTYVTARLPGGESFLFENGVRVHRITVGPRLRGLNFLFDDALYSVGLKRYLAATAGQFDVLHAMGAFEVTAPFMASTAPAVGAHSVVRFSSLGELEFLRSRSLVGRVIWRRVLRANWYVGNSAPVLDKMVQGYDLAPGRCTLIPNAVEFGPGLSRPEARTKLGWPAEWRVVLCVAKFDPLKNQQLLVEAWPPVAARFPDARLVFIGSGPMLARCRALALRLSVADSVIFRGRAGSAEVGDALAASDVFAYPSKWEGQPNALLEALAAGLPCAASDIPGNRSLARPAIEAEYFEAGSSGGAADAVSRLLGDSEYARALGQAAFERMCREHRIDVIADQWVALYRRLTQ